VCHGAVATRFVSVVGVLLQRDGHRALRCAHRSRRSPAGRLC
jgi:hypothetical protein